MKKLYVSLVAGLFSAFFIVKSPIAVAEDNGFVCDPVTLESVLQNGAKESPELLMAVVEGSNLTTFFDRMRKTNMLFGEVQYDKLYIFLSENHPHWVYVYFLKEGCIHDVKFTYKNLVEYFMSGDESLIRKG